VHVTLGCGRAVGRLRKFKLYPLLRRAMAGANARGDFRICQYSVQRDHIHLICEADSARALANGMRSLKNRITKAFNKLLGREGSIFEGRYHTHTLQNPRSVRNALAYVLLNGRKHGEHRAAAPPSGIWIDPFSSAYYFDGWKGRRDGRLGDPPRGPPPVQSPQSWLLAEGWRRHGLIGLSEMPGRS
jgi:putative transposase